MSLKNKLYVDPLPSLAVQCVYGTVNTNMRGSVNEEPGSTQQS